MHGRGAVGRAACTDLPLPKPYACLCPAPLSLPPEAALQDVFCDSAGAVVHALSLHSPLAAGPATFCGDLGGHVGPAPAPSGVAAECRCIDGRGQLAPQVLCGSP